MEFPQFAMNELGIRILLPVSVQPSRFTVLLI